MVSSGEQLMLSPILLMRIVALKLVLGLKVASLHLLNCLCFLMQRSKEQLQGPYGLWPLKMMRTKADSGVQCSVHSYSNASV
nr:hypothetical protein Iba_chr08dCG8330 [Ipomoea batatas]